MKRLRLVLAIALFLTYLGSVSKAFAASYDVSAEVHFPTPTQAAVINTALNNTTLENAAFVIAGTCEDTSPATVISIYRGPTVLGSISCTSGTFSLQVTLVEGLNTLLARTANVSHDFGPDSTTIAVTLNTPPTPVTPIEPEPSTPATPTTPGATNLTVTENNAINQGVETNLSIVPQAPFTVLPNDNNVSLSFVIAGGSTPYTIELNWGDGSVETKVINEPGTYTFTHQYRSAGNYTVKGKIRDVLGAVTEVTYAVMAPKPTEDKTAENTTQNQSPPNPITHWIGEHWVATTAGTASVAVVASAFWIGKSSAETAAVASNLSPKGKTLQRPTKSTQPNIKAKPKPRPRGKR